jgi:hypothetical protein
LEVVLERNLCEVTTAMIAASFLCRIPPPSILRRTALRSFALLDSPFYFPSNRATMDPQTQVDISSLSDADKKELNTVLTNEAQKSSIQQGECPYVYPEAQRNNASAILMS